MLSLKCVTFLSTHFYRQYREMILSRILDLLHCEILSSLSFVFFKGHLSIEMLCVYLLRKMSRICWPYSRSDFSFRNVVGVCITSRVSFCGFVQCHWNICEVLWISGIYIVKAMIFLYKTIAIHYTKHNVRYFTEQTTKIYNAGRFSADHWFIISAIRKVEKKIRLLEY